VTAGLLLGGLSAGVMVSAGAALDDPPAADYEIVRSSFSDGGQSVEGTARCSNGKLVMGGGARVLDEGTMYYAIVASDPLGPSGWSATFARHPETEAEAEPSPIVPGTPAPGPGPEEEEEPGETEFEVSAVCATIR
jgi:hypothetical protein